MNASPLKGPIFGRYRKRVEFGCPHPGFSNEISAANIMNEVAEFSAAEWVIAEILDDRASVGIGVSLFELVFRKSRISLE